MQALTTVSRHLGRPAHRLTVTKEAISSFDIEDEDYLHPRVGVCRRCWRQFSNRQAFEEHAAGSCDKVSKGKREKWQILHDSFTPLLDSAVAVDNLADTSLNFGEVSMQDEPMHSPARPSGFISATAPWSQAPVSPAAASIPSPVSYFPRRSALSASASGEALVPAQEYERVQKERNHLRERTQQLERILAERGLALQSSGPSGGMLLSGGSAAARSVAPISDASPVSPDRDSLVLHMGSKPEEVDVQGLMNEPQENLSRQNSDMSSGSRSTVHHVTTSPPQRLVEYEEGDRSKGGQQNNTATPNRNACPSIPDSGYSSAGHRRYGSFGDIGHMPGEMHQGHQRTHGNFSVAPYPQRPQQQQQPGKPHNNPRGPDEVFQNTSISWRPTLFAPLTPAPAQQGAAGQFQQAQPHTFLPGQTPAQGEGIDDFFPDLFEM